MSVTFLNEYARDPAKAVRRQLEQLWAQNEREVAAASKNAEELRYAAGYAERHKPESPDAA